MSPCVARLRYMVSFYAIVDFLAVFPYYFAQTFDWVDQYDNYLRLLRLLRILKVPRRQELPEITPFVFRSHLVFTTSQSSYLEVGINRDGLCPVAFFVSAGQVQPVRHPHRRRLPPQGQRINGCRLCICRDACVVLHHHVPCGEGRRRGTGEAFEVCIRGILFYCCFICLSVCAEVFFSCKRSRKIPPQTDNFCFLIFIFIQISHLPG